MADKKIMEWLQRDLDSDLSEAEEKMLKKHLAESEKDRRYAESLREVSRQLSLLPKVDPPCDIVKDVLDEIDQEESSPSKGDPPIWSRTRWPLAGKAIAAMAVFGLIGLFAFMNFQPSEKENGKIMGDSGPQEEVDILMESAGDPAPAEESGAQVWSPDQTYRAEWKQGTLVVFKADGTLQYERSFASNDTRIHKMEWSTDQTLKVTLQEGRKSPQSIIIDVEKKEEVH